MNRIGDRALIWTAIIMMLFVLWSLDLMKISVARVKVVAKVLQNFSKHDHLHSHLYTNVFLKRRTGGNYEEGTLRYKSYER